MTGRSENATPVIYSGTPSRPITVKVLVWLWCVLGTLSILLGLSALHFAATFVNHRGYEDVVPALILGIGIILGIGVGCVFVGYGLQKVKKWAWNTAVGIALLSIVLGSVIILSIVFRTSLTNLLTIFSLLVTASLTKLIPISILPAVVKVGYFVAGIVVLTLLMRKSVRKYFKISYGSSNRTSARKIIIIMTVGITLTTFGYSYATGIFGTNTTDGIDKFVSESPYNLNIEAQTVIDNLGDCGTSFVFVPDGRIFCAELKSGKVRVIENFQLLAESMVQLDVYHEMNDERGLIGITIDPRFEENHYVYLHWTYLDSDNQTYRRVAKFTESDNKLKDMKIILDKIPSGTAHNGGPLEFGYDGKLYITGGDATDFDQTGEERAQDVSSLAGKIFRINSDGSIPDDNPFPGSPVYTLGHRNVFGIGFDPITKIPYITENGPEFYDEVNVLIAGKNYGWPYVLGKGYSYDPNFDYMLKSIEGPLLGEERFRKSLLEFTSTIAPTELVFYTGDRYTFERNNMFFLSYITAQLYRVEKPTLNEVSSFNAYDIRHEGVDTIRGLGGTYYNGLLDIEQGPDGYLYISSFDKIMRLDFSYSNITGAQPDSKEWSVAADVLKPADEIRAAAIGSKIYAVGGLNQSLGSTNTVQVYDSISNTWSDGKRLPVALDHVGLASYNDKLYVVGGFRGGLIASDFLFIFDPLTDEWTRGADMPTARGALTAEFVDGILYAVGGIDGLSLTTNEAYDPITDSWTKKAPMPTARDHLTSGVVDGKLYVIGGREGNTLTNLNVNEEYDPKKDEWVVKAPMPSSRGGLVAASLSGSIYVFCGETPTRVFSNNEQYIPSLDKWIVRDDMPSGRHGCASASIGDSIYVIGGGVRPGFSLDFLSSKNEVFTPLNWKTIIANPKS